MINKSIYIAIGALAIFFAFSCSRHKVKATVVKDCSGVYLRINFKDHLVCNDEMLSNIPDNGIIAVDFHKENNCISYETVCMLYHPYEDVIVVDKIY